MGEKCSLEGMGHRGQVYIKGGSVTLPALDLYDSAVVDADSVPFDSAFATVLPEPERLSVR